MGKTCPFAGLSGYRYGWVILLVFALALVGGWYRGRQRTPEQSLSGPTVKDIDPEELESLLSGGKPGVLEFYTKGCPFCVKIEPELAKLKDTYGEEVFVVKMNAEIHPQEAAKYEVRGVPTLIFFDSTGHTKRGLAGYRDFAIMSEMLKELEFVK